MMCNMHSSNNDNNNNECQKFPEETFFKNKLTFMKKAVLHTTTLMHCKARQVLRELFGTTQK